MTALSSKLLLCLRRFLDRRSVPLIMRGNDRAIQDELTALLNIIVKFAPEDPEQFDEWWARLETEIGKINMDAQLAFRG